MRRWVWIPGDARRIEAESMLMVEYPESFQYRWQVVRVDPAAPPELVLRDVAAAAADLGAEQVLLWPGLAPTPRLEIELGRRGAQVVERVAILAGRLVNREEVTSAASPEVSVRPVESAADLVDYTRISTQVFGGVAQPRSPKEVEAHVEAIRRGWDEGIGGEMLARRNGGPVGVAGVTIAGADARLWGAAVLPEFRRTGVYGALLQKRIEVAAAEGATLAVVKARTESSAPILRKRGFARFGEESAYLCDPRRLVARV